MSDTLDVSGVEEHHERKRQKSSIMQEKTLKKSRVVRARFALGNDDGAYLRLNVMPLQTVIDDEDYRLSSKMTADMRNASYIGLLDAYEASCNDKLSKQDPLIESLWRTLSWMLSVAEVGHFVRGVISHSGESLCDSSKAQLVIKAAEGFDPIPDMSDPKVVSALKAVIGTVLSLFQENVKKGVEAQLKVQSTTSTAVRKDLEYVISRWKASSKEPWILDLVEVMTDAKQKEYLSEYDDVTMLHAYLSVDGSGDKLDIKLNNADDGITYCLARGLCGQRAPHHAIDNESDSLLYSVPKVRCPTIEHISDMACHELFGQSFTLGATYKTIPLVRDFCSIKDEAKSNVAKWAPPQEDELDKIDIGKHAVAVAAACVIENLVTYYKKSASESEDVELKLSLMAHCAFAKVYQLQFMSVIFELDQGDLDELCDAKEFQTVPVQRGQDDRLLYASNAGLFRAVEISTGSGEEVLTIKEEIVQQAEKEEPKREEDFKALQRNLDAGIGAAFTEITLSEHNKTIANQVTNLYIANAVKKVESSSSTSTRDDVLFGSYPESAAHRESLSIDNLTSCMSFGANLCDERLKMLKNQKSTASARSSLQELQKQDLDTTALAIDQAARTRREEVWNDSMREAAIAGDRLYAFVRQLSGTIHETVDAVCVVDESMLVRQQKDRQADAKRLSMMASQQQMQLVSNVFRSVINESGLTLGIDEKKGLDGELKVVSNTLRKQVSELTSGSSSSEGFFTNSVKLENLLARGTGEITLSGLFSKLREVGLALQDAAMNDSTDTGNPVGPSLDFLSSPRNSLILRWKPEAHAALRTAFDTFQREMTSRHRMMGTLGRHRKISAYELIEGRSDELSMAFATYCAHTLAHQRMFSAGQAAYLGQWAARANIAAMKFSCDKLISIACEYVFDTERPDFVYESGWENYFGVRNHV